MKTAIQPTDLTEVEGEPRIHDLRLAKLLGFKRPTDIRELITRHTRELGRHGGLPCPTVNSRPSGGRPGKDVWLNEAHAILICMKSETPKAEEVREDIIRVFRAWKRGEVAVKASPVTVSVMETLPGTALAPVNDKITHIQRGQEELVRQVGETATNVVYLSNRLDGFVPRRDFSTWVQEQYRRVCLAKYSGECPSCRKVRIVADDGSALDGIQNDHFSRA